MGATEDRVREAFVELDAANAELRRGGIRRWRRPEWLSPEWPGRANDVAPSCECGRLTVQCFCSAVRVRPRELG